MPISGSNVFGLMILSLGILGIIVSFLITDRKKYLIALSLAALVVLMGTYEYVGTGLRQWQAAHRIAKLQEQQRQNLQALQERLRQTQSQAVHTPAPKEPTPAKK